MGWSDAVAMAWRELARRPGRALLTMIAVALAASLLTALVAIATTARTRVLDQITHGGPLSSISVAAAAPNPSQTGLDNPTPGPAKTLTKAALTSIGRLDHVVAVVPVLRAVVLVDPPPKPPSGSRLCLPPRAACHRYTEVNPTQLGIVGVNLRDVNSLPVSLITGQFPAPGSTTEIDVTSGYLGNLGLAQTQAREVVGTDVELGEYRVGRGFSIALRWTTAEIVGVVDEQAGSGELLGYPALVQAEFNWISAGRAFGDSDAPTSPYAGAVIEADQLSDVNVVRAGIARVGYSSSAPEDIIVSVEKYLHVIEIILSAIGFVALAIAALGIANALLAAVRERRREIGVMKAIGARDRDVMRTFLVEAGCLGLVGGILGTAIGVVIFLGIGDLANSYLTAQGLSGVPITLAWDVPVGATVGAAVVSVAAGAFPARRAARLSAREAVEA